MVNESWLQLVFQAGMPQFPSFCRSSSLVHACHLPNFAVLHGVCQMRAEKWRCQSSAEISLDNLAKLFEPPAKHNVLQNLHDSSFLVPCLSTSAFNSQ